MAIVDYKDWVFSGIFMQLHEGKALPNQRIPQYEIGGTTYYSAREFARRIGESSASVARWLKKNKYPIMRINGLSFVPSWGVIVASKGDTVHRWKIYSQKTPEASCLSSCSISYGSNTHEMIAYTPEEIVSAIRFVGTPCVVDEETISKNSLSEYMITGIYEEIVIGGVAALLMAFREANAWHVKCQSDGRSCLQGPFDKQHKDTVVAAALAGNFQKAMDLLA